MHFKQVASLAVLPLLVVAAPARLTVSFEIDTSTSSFKVTELYPETKTSDRYGVNGVAPPTTTSASKALELFSEYRKLQETTSKKAKALKFPNKDSSDDEVEQYKTDVITVGQLIVNQTVALESVMTELDTSELEFNRADSKNFGEVVLQVFANFNESLTDPLVQQPTKGSVSFFVAAWGPPLQKLWPALLDFSSITSSKLTQDNDDHPSDEKFFEEVVDTISKAADLVEEARLRISFGTGWTLARNEDIKPNVAQWKIGL